MTGWNMPPGCNVSDIDGDGILDLDEDCLDGENTAEENAYWDREYVRWVMDLPNTQALIYYQECNPILFECLYNIAVEMENYLL